MPIVKELDADTSGIWWGPQLVAVWVDKLPASLIEALCLFIREEDEWERDELIKELREQIAELEGELDDARGDDD